MKRKTGKGMNKEQFTDALCIYHSTPNIWAEIQKCILCSSVKFLWIESYVQHIFKLIDAIVNMKLLSCDDSPC